MSRTITWLHISDLHAGKPGMGWDSRRVIEKLVDDLRRMEGEHGLHPDFIFFTGDAAFGQIGSSPSETLVGQYELAQEFFDSVRRAFSPEVPRSNLFLVPGNHDVNRKAVTPGQIEWLDRQDDPYKICDILEKGGLQWKRYMERLADYSRFLEDNGYSHLLDDPDHLTYAIVREVKGIKVGIGGFNSVWSCCRNSRIEKGRLWMGSRWQLERIWSGFKDTDVTISLFHHPANWLVEKEDKELWRKLQADFKFVLHGHEHAGWIEPISGGYTRVAAGACYNRSDKENGYNLVRLNLDAGEGQVWLRKYSDAGGGGWVPHVIPGRTTDQGLWELQHLDWLKAEPSLSTSNTNQPAALPPNPFIDVFAIRDPARFVGRKAVLDRLLRVLSAGSIALVGERKVGKSSLLHRLAALLRQEPGQAVVFWDFFDPLEVTQLLAAATKALGSDGESWEEFKTAVRGLRVVLLLDEFDVAPERGFDLDIIRGCRALCQVERGLRLVTASRALPKEIFADSGRGSWPYDFLALQQLGPFTPDEARRLLAHTWAPDAPRFDDSTSEYLITLSGCHPYRLQRAAHHRYEALCDPAYDWRAAYELDMEALR